jgi:hypothetical protein
VYTVTFVFCHGVPFSKTRPVPFGTKFRLMFVSEPVTPTAGEPTDDTDVIVCVPDPALPALIAVPPGDVATVMEVDVPPDKM